MSLNRQFSKKTTIYRPNGEYTLNYRLKSGARSQKFNLGPVPFERTLRVTNFDSLQSWDGAPYLVSWIAVQNPMERVSSLSLRQPNGSTAFTVPTFTGSGLGPPGFLGDFSSSITVASLSSFQGDVFEAYLSFSSSTRGISGTGANLVSGTDTVILRFPLTRPALAPLITAQPLSATLAQLNFEHTGVSGSLATFTSVGAFPFSSPTSRDAAVTT